MPCREPRCAGSRLRLSKSRRGAAELDDGQVARPTGTYFKQLRDAHGEVRSRLEPVKEWIKPRQPREGEEHSRPFLQSGRENPRTATFHTASSGTNSPGCECGMLTWNVGPVEDPVLICTASTFSFAEDEHRQALPHWQLVYDGEFRGGPIAGAISSCIPHHPAVTAMEGHPGTARGSARPLQPASPCSNLGKQLEHRTRCCFT